MRTITFYSYKGGVGRTLTAANFAVYLANLGLTTVVVDFDLEAPGIDSKFLGLEMPQAQKGVLDYILEYQLNNADPGSIDGYYCRVPLPSFRGAAPLWLIPAGQYDSPEYNRGLSRLDWNSIFARPDSLAFFQQFLARIKETLKADFVIIDSRTGITESSGLCTQYLADEVVMLTSLSLESIKATGKYKRLIEHSPVAQSLGKTIDVKVVVSRVPRPDDIDALKSRYSELFDVDEDKLFFLFSSPKLEEEEYLAITAFDRDEELATNYVRLFYGLNIEIATHHIQEEIARTTRDLLSMSPEQAEKNVMELVALYPHPKVYRTAIHFFRLIRNRDQMRNYCRKLLNLVPEDEEAQGILARTYLESNEDVLRALRGIGPAFVDPETGEVVRRRAPRAPQSVVEAVRAIDPLWQKGELTPEETLRYAELLEGVGEYMTSLEIALTLESDERLAASDRLQARIIAARTAQELGQQDVVADLIARIPAERLPRSLGREAVRLREESGDLDGAFDLAKELLERDSSLLEQAANLARQLNRLDEIEEVLRSAEYTRALSRSTSASTFRGRLRRLGLFRVLSELEPAGRR